MNVHDKALDPRLRAIYITDPEVVGARQTELIEILLAAGIRAVQLRMPQAPAAELHAAAIALRAVTRRHDALLVINDRLDVALAVEADGCHLGRRGLPLAAARKLAGARLLLGYSAHSLDEALLAADAGADYASLSPVFPTKSKSSALPPLGLERLKLVCLAAPLPIVALGGIEPLTVAPCLKAGARGVAMIGALSRVDDPAQAARQTMSAVGGLSQTVLEN